MAGLSDTPSPDDSGVRHGHYPQTPSYSMPASGDTAPPKVPVPHRSGSACPEGTSKPLPAAYRCLPPHCQTHSAPGYSPPRPPPEKLPAKKRHTADHPNARSTYILHVRPRPFPASGYTQTDPTKRYPPASHRHSLPPVVKTFPLLSHLHTVATDLSAPPASRRHWPDGSYESPD